MIKILIAAALIYYFFFNGETWSGWVYPDKDNLRYSKSIGEYKSLEECRDVALDMLMKYPNGDYECGLDCEYNKDLGVDVCKETTR